MVPWVGLQYVIVAFLGHTHLLFKQNIVKYMYKQIAKFCFKQYCIIKQGDSDSEVILCFGSKFKSIVDLIQ